MHMENIKKRMAEHCIANVVDATAEMIDLSARISVKAHGADKVILALDSLAVHSRFFTSPANITEELQKLASNGDTIDNIAISKMEETIKSFHDCGFDYPTIKAEIGEDLYEAIGGAMFIKDFERTDINDMIGFKAQFRGKIKAYLSAKQSKTRVDATEKIAGKGEVERIMSDKPNKVKAVDFNKFLPDNS